jgi:hypothetical protein
MAVTDLASARLYIKTSLGGGSVGQGVLNIQMSVEQLNQCIEKSIQTFQRYNHGEGTYEDFLVLTISAGVSAYSLAGSNVSDVIDFDLANATQSTNINHLFSPANMVLGSPFTVFNDGQGMAISNYQVMMNYLETINDVFGISFRYDYRELQETLVITPTPTESGHALIKVFRKESSSLLYNHLLIKDLSVALAKQIWGKILSRYGSMALPGGGENFSFGSKLWDEGKEEQKDIEMRMKNEGEAYVGFIIG